MTNVRQLIDALSEERPDQAAQMRQALKENRDTRRDADPDIEDQLTHHLRAKLRAGDSQSSGKRVKHVVGKGKKAAHKIESDINAARKAAAAEKAKAEKKMADYHQERTESPDYLPPDQFEPLGPVAPEDIAGYQRDAARTERDAKKQWRARVGNKDESGVGWDEHRRNEAAQSLPLNANPEADGKELAAFQALVTSGNAPWMAPNKPFDPLEGHVSARTARKDKRATAAAEASLTTAEQVGAKPRRVSDRPDTQPPPTRGGR